MQDPGKKFRIAAEPSLMVGPLPLSDPEVLPSGPVSLNWSFTLIEPPLGETPG